MAEYSANYGFSLQALRPGDTIKTWKGTLVVVPRVDVILGVERGWARPEECSLMERDALGFWLCHYDFIELMASTGIIGCDLCTRSSTPCYFQWRG